MRTRLLWDDPRDRWCYATGTENAPNCELSTTYLAMISGTFAIARERVKGASRVSDSDRALLQSVQAIRRSTQAEAECPDGPQGETA